MRFVSLQQKAPSGSHPSVDLRTKIDGENVPAIDDQEASDRASLLNAVPRRKVSHFDVTQVDRVEAAAEMAGLVCSLAALRTIQHAGLNVGGAKNQGMMPTTITRIREMIAMRRSATPCDCFQ
jgi:hypothetical protein